MILLFIIILSLSSGRPAECSTADQFKTAEYYASTGLNLINAADAYALGYTGRGVVLGICDDYVKLSHPEFAGKLNSSTVLLVPAGFDWTRNSHGTHVGGIMAAARNNVGMHGVAFDADLLSGDPFGSPFDIRLSYAAFNRNSGVKIINNSWGTDYYIDEIGGGKAAVLALFAQKTDKPLPTLENSITDYDKVLVFAAGNNGHTTPGGESMLAYLKPQTAGNFINVMLVDPAKFDTATKTAGSSFVGIFSDLVKYGEENSVAAPGLRINSTYAANDSYITMSGTSMAAPYVAGTAGLVQQAFPYMGGRQIVDTVLSTADKTFTLPGYTVTVQEDYADPSDPGSGRDRRNINLFYFGSKPDAATITQHLRQYYSENEQQLRAWYGFATADQFVAATIKIYDNVPREMIFGQGLLNAGAAVRGPGLLNARRMDGSSYSPAAEYGRAQALYAVDTQGYDSIWSNDIGETRAGLLASDSAYEDLRRIYAYYIQGDNFYGFHQGQDYIDEYNARVAANGLQGLPVGLLKRGRGTLALTGDNTYQGSSVAAGGTLQIDGRVAGDAFSVETGTIAGSGIIKGNLYNRSTVQAGSYGNPGTLTVEGNFASTGKIAVAATGSANGKITVLGSAGIDGTAFAPVAGSVYRPGASYEILTAGSITGSFTAAAFTGMLSAGGSHDGTSARLLLTRENNLATPNASQLQVYRRMEAMYDRLAGQAAQRQLDPLYSLSAAEAKQALTEIYGGAQLNQAGFTQQSVTVGSAVAARMNYVKHRQDTTVSFKISGFAEGDFEARAVIPLELDDNDSWWLKLTRNWGEIDAQNDSPGIKNQSFGLILGRDRQAGNHWRTGMLVAFGNNDTSSDIARTGSKDYRVGVYAGYDKGAVNISTCLDYGHQTNSATRYLRQLGLQATSSYGSRTLAFGAEAKYNLSYAKEKDWDISPYVSFNVTRYIQDSYGESGAGIYSQQADGLKNTYSTGQFGLEIGRQLPKGRYALKIGYEKVFGGSNPEMTVAYSGNPGEKLTISGGEQDREYFVLGISAQGYLGDNWKIEGEVTRAAGRHSRHLNASLMACRYW
ncbi:S8 family serine peptidase [Anaeroselena agilis]|uniref:S8 family serine peptidase n=1 Tax=Anaeroselena agilis TaxID=3063788 RepID=A0ABU3NT51_9FIRM|nr:S8 family serine peptidase [Selenomonadales bacterium 4137-cl]